MIFANVSDYREQARRRLPRFLFDYIDGGAFSETTLRSNVEDLSRLRIRQNVLRDVSALSLETELLGQKFAMPVGLAPIGLAGLTARRGEVQAARAAHKAGVPFTLSTVSACTCEEVAKGAPNPFWFQLYVIKDRGFMRDMLARAKAAGASALFLTVDMPVPGTRYRDMRSGLSGGGPMQRRLMRLMQASVKPRWSWDVGLLGGPHTLGHVSSVLGKSAGVEEFWAWMGANFDASVTWKDLEAIRSQWSGPLVVKGILTADDARSAIAAGANGVVVSNHGGRQLDGARSSISALPPIADAIGGKATVFMDGGVRTGLDVVRALASGANGVLLGRAWVYGLAARGEHGVSEILRIIASEMRTALALSGHSRIADVGRHTLDLDD
ncbi:MAG TPA: L-lactate dehydrogenase [Hyphomonadaceae bacterium]|jgi:L-lactate dehydrogenase (cytochrome)|nr:L-lactate dehydrogenase [Hyphomonadaceae bacterium]